MAMFNSYVCLPEAFLEFGRKQISHLLSKVTDANLFGNIPGRFWRTQGVNKFLGMRKIKSSLICIYHYIYIFIYLLINFYLTISLSRISLSLYLPICRSVFLSTYLPMQPCDSPGATVNTRYQVLDDVWILRTFPHGETWLGDVGRV